MKAYLLLFVLVFVLTSCKNEPKPVVFSTEILPNAYESKILVSFDKAEGKQDGAKSINNSIEKELIKAVPNAENSATLKDALKRFDNDYITFKAQFADESHPWELTLETETTYQSPNVITIGVSSYADTGGAHGNDRIQIINFNPTTGTLYSLSDIINDIPEFKKIAKTYFIKNLESENLSITEFFFGDDFKLPENIGFSDNGLVLLYNAYEIASYSQGYTEFAIPFAELQPYLKVN